MHPDVHEAWPKHSWSDQSTNLAGFKKKQENGTQTLGHLARSAGESNLIKIRLSCQAPRRSSRSLILMNRACYRSCGGDGGWLEQELCLTAAGVSARGKKRAARDTNERRQLRVSGFTFLQTVGIRLWRRPELQSIKENTVEIKTRGMEQNRNKHMLEPGIEGANAPE